MQRTFSLVSMILLLCAASKAQTSYVPEVYPLVQSGVGEAHLYQSDGKYTLGNNLFDATFIEKDGTLVFGGCPEMNLLPETELFRLVLGSSGSIVKDASQLVMDSIWTENLVGSETAVKGSEHFNGKALCARFLHGTSGIFQWKAILRDGSHYLRTELELTPKQGKNLRFHHIIPMMYNVDSKAAGSVPRANGNTRGKVLLSERIFAGLETPMAYNTSSADVEDEGYDVVSTWSDSWSSSQWNLASQDIIPKRVNELGFYYSDVMFKTKEIAFDVAGRLSVEFLYSSGNNRLNICGVDLVDEAGNEVASEYHSGYTGNAKENNIYRFEVPYPGKFTLRYWVEKKTEPVTSSGTINIKLEKLKQEEEGNSGVVALQGLWSRNTTLLDGETWKVSSVVGLVGAENARRSFLAYSERERAVPWRPFPVYISWYELNIDRNNAQDPTKNMNAEQVLDVLSHWKTDFYDKYGIAPQAFVIDDGWDNYGTWTFHSGFPNEMRDIAESAKEMGAGIGAWLGPVGGYGTSGYYRRAYWNQDGRGGMVLSNPAYYKVFKDAAYNLVMNQGEVNDREDNTYRFFKFDGISDDFSANGPDKDLDEDIANENAEGIIRLERYVREELKEDIFFNTTVGTWASPFWYHYTDATWRQEKDYGTIGNNSIDRENWITYRDRLVYQNYVTNNPICPINTLMTHGFILSKFGSVSKNMTYDACLREMRCAFACGSGMVELYADYALMNSINKGKLWEDLAECIAWQKANADVLPDVHWVGGNPWTGSKAEVYGWASWNGMKSTLALRNGSNNSQRFTTTLRDALEIPASVKGRITLSKAFRVQGNLPGLVVGEPIDIDEVLNLTLPASSLFVFDGVDSDDDSVGRIVLETPTSRSEMPSGVYDLQGRKVFGSLDSMKSAGTDGRGVFIVDGKKFVR